MASEPMSSEMSSEMSSDMAMSDCELEPLPDDGDGSVDTMAANGVNDGQATVVVADVQVDNGVVHVIDGVLMPGS